MQVSEKVTMARPGRRGVTTALSVLSTASIFVAFVLALLMSRPSCSVALESAHWSGTPPVYMLVLLVNERNLSRIYLLERVWGSDFRHLSPLSIYRVGVARPRLRIVGATIISPHVAMEAAVQLHYTFEHHLGLFLNVTKFRWFVRTTEDCFVHLKRLPGLLKDLESKYDPLRDIVILGQSVEINEHISMVHGGAGWVMSRAACRFYRRRRHEIVRRWNAMAAGDDVMPHFLRHAANLTSNQTNHYSFLGSPFDNPSFERIRAGRFDGLSPCPSWGRQQELKRIIIPVDQNVFWHSGRNDMLVVMDGYRISRYIRRGLAFAHVPDAVTLCDMRLAPNDASDALWT
jgi:hypothetical protein